MAHITESQRYTIEVMLQEGYKQTEIARAIGKDKSVVSREIRRNIDLRSGKYRSYLATRKYNARMVAKRKQIKFTPKYKS